VAVAPLATVVQRKAGVVTLRPIAVTTVPPILANVVLPVTSPLTASVAQMARFVLTPVLAIAAPAPVGVETRLTIAVLVVRRASATVL
jgi:hypothetical protein